MDAQQHPVLQRWPDPLNLSQGTVAKRISSGMGAMKWQILMCYENFSTYGCLRHIGHSAIAYTGTGSHRIRAAGWQLEARAEDERLCGGNHTGLSPEALRPRAAADRTIASVLVAGSRSRALNMRDSATVTVGLWMSVCAGRSQR